MVVKSWKQITQCSFTFFSYDLQDFKALKISSSENATKICAIPVSYASAAVQCTGQASACHIHKNPSGTHAIN